MTSSTPSRASVAAAALTQRGAARPTSATLALAQLDAVGLEEAGRSGLERLLDDLANQPSRQRHVGLADRRPRLTRRWTGRASRYSLATTTSGLLGRRAWPVRQVDRLPLEAIRQTQGNPSAAPPGRHRAACRGRLPTRAPRSATGEPARRQVAARKRPRQRPKNGCSSGAVRKSPSRVGRSVAGRVVAELRARSAHAP